jgi:hypothetical protein
MNKKTAKQIINNQIEKLSAFNSPSEFHGNWKIQTKTYIELFFGNDSDQFKYMKNIEGVSSAYRSDPTKFLKDCIELIDNIGLYKKPKQNFLYTMPNWVAMLAFPLMLTIGIAFGNFQAKTQSITPKEDNSSIIIDTPSSVTKNIADTITNRKNDTK